mmetsp:Transcript_28286/g.91201  ORF Transcript_28286/g.91201 Transcript_28286/m.91201 type:complete len:288 (-) Transcript_28286:37-900(-)
MTPTLDDDDDDKEEEDLFFSWRSSLLRTCDTFSAKAAPLQLSKATSMSLVRRPSALSRTQPPQIRTVVFSSFAASTKTSTSSASFNVRSTFADGNSAAVTVSVITRSELSLSDSSTGFHRNFRTFRLCFFGCCCRRGGEEASSAVFPSKVVVLPLFFWSSSSFVGASRAPPGSSRLQPREDFCTNSAASPKLTPDVGQDDVTRRGSSTRRVTRRVCCRPGLVAKLSLGPRRVCTFGVNTNAAPRPPPPPKHRSNSRAILPTPRGDVVPSAVAETRPRRTTNGPTDGD